MENEKIHEFTSRGSTLLDDLNKAIAEYRESLPEYLQDVENVPDDRDLTEEEERAAESLANLQRAAQDLESFIFNMVEA